MWPLSGYEIETPVLDKTIVKIGNKNGKLLVQVNERNVNWNRLVNPVVSFQQLETIKLH